MALVWGLLIAAGATTLVGCIDDRPSGPGRIRDSGGSISEGSSGSANSAGGSASGGTSVHSQSLASGGQKGSGGETGSVTSSGGRDGTSSSHSASSGTAGGGGATASSPVAGSSAGAGQGGTSQSSSGGSGGTASTASSSANRDAGVAARDAYAPADAAGVVSFANQIQPMLKSNCTSCHGSSQQSAGVRLDSYTAVKANLSKASNAISKGIMPPSGGLKTDLRQLFQTWVDQGALNN